MKELIANPGKYEELIAMKTYDQSWKVLVMGVLIFLYACAAKTPNGKVNCFSVVGSLDYTIQADGGEIHVELSNDADHIFVLSPKSWCKAKMTNEKGEGYVQIMVEPNTEATNRAAKIMLSSNHDCPNTELTVQQIGAKTGGDPNTGKLKVSSYNIRYAAKADIETGNGWEVRKQHVANLITTHNFDIVGTQEGNDAQLADLKAHLPAYNFVGHTEGPITRRIIVQYFTKKNGILCLTRAFFGSVRPRTSPVSVGMLMTSESVIGQNSKNWKQAWNSTSSQHIFIGDIRRQD